MNGLQGSEKMKSKNKFKSKKRFDYGFRNQYTKRKISYYRRLQKENEKRSKSIDIDKLLSMENFSVLYANSEGVIELDIENPAHRRWMED
jgi:hypothetical protein